MPFLTQRKTLSLASICFAALLSYPQSANAHDDLADKVDEIVTYGRAIDKIGEATAASEGTVGYADFEDRPFSRAGELVEVIPGAVATQHSGEGKANQYFLRGFNLDHGTDFSASVDGVPVNLRTHGHGQGYLDLNFVIPELAEIQRYDGPWDLDQDLKKLNGLAKLIHNTRNTESPLRAVESGLIDRFGFIDDDLGGGAKRASLSLQTSLLSADGSLTDFSLYAVDYDFTLFSNFTYFLNDPENGDEFEQRN